MKYISVISGSREPVEGKQMKVVENLTGKKVHWNYLDQNRIGNHICYISDLRKLKECISNLQEHILSKSVTLIRR
jgi:hypothetical protein